MKDYQVGITPADLLLPREDVNMTTWACVACDQYTSQPDYWAETALQVGTQPSTLHLMLPECWLDEANARIPDIHRTMQQYLDEGILRTAVKNGFVLVERSTGSGARVGLVCTVDLEAYDNTKGSKSLVRPTEETIAARLPARMAVREGAPLEMSHILLLMDDPMQSVVEPLYANRESLPVLYDCPLMQDGGHVKGWAVANNASVEGVMNALTLLKAQQGADPLLFAVGDGNHSLTTAKAAWEAIKPTLTPEQQKVHPARYALCEIENIHDDALSFAPIHRLLTGVNGDALMHDWTLYCHQRGMDLSEVTDEGEEEQVMRVLYGGNETVAAITNPDGAMAVDTLQRYLDDFMARHPEAKLDYIHGDDTLRSLSFAADAVGFLLPELDKDAFFPAIRRLGVLPRKTFSMGEAHEKRFYMECRVIR